MNGRDRLCRRLRPVRPVRPVRSPHLLHLLRRMLAAVGGLALLGVLLSALPAAASAAATSGGGGRGVFGLTPMPRGDGTVASYFQLHAVAGHTVSASAFITNPGKTTETLKISPSTGGTAANGSSTFTRAFQPCTGTGCWVTGIPATVRLTPGTGERLQFSVSVPPGTAPGQYLAGITAESASAPAPVNVRTNGKAHAKAIIIDQVTVGVAVTIGSLPALTSRLEIPSVSATLLGSLVRLNIGLKNTGQTFAHGTGQAACVADGKRHPGTFTASTVLPGDQAVIAANATGIPKGTTAMRCTVRIRYERGQTVSWSGQVTIPQASSARIVHTGPGAYSTVPAAGIPWWAIALIVIVVLLLGALTVLLIRLRNPAQPG